MRLQMSGRWAHPFVLPDIHGQIMRGKARDYFEIMHELKLIVDLYYRGGLKFMNYSVSDTAEYGGLTVGPKIVTEDAKNAMRAALKRIQSGEFAKEWLGEHQSGGKNFQRLREADASHPVEKAGAELRKMMPWIK